MWVQKGDRVERLALNLPDQGTRLLADGWVEVPEPRVLTAMDTPEAVAEAQPPTEAAPAPLQRSPLPPLDVPVVALHTRQAQQRGRR